MTSHSGQPGSDYAEPPPPESVAHNYQAAYGWGGAPPPPGYGRDRGGMPSWLKVLLIGCAVLFVGVGALVGFGVYQMRKMGFLPNVPKAKVHAGAPIQWIELERWKGGSGFMSPGMFGSGLTVGNFDSDQAPEILRIVPPRGSAFAPWNASSAMPASNVLLYELDGTKRQVTLGNMLHIFSAQGWDYDGDGVLEIACESGNVEVYSASGQFVSTLSGSPMYTGQRQADVDGDGYPELLLSDPLNNGQMVAIGQNGNKVWTSGNNISYGCAWGDVDGDGLDEYLDPYSGGSSGLTATDMNGQTNTFSSWSYGSLFNSIGNGFEGLCCVDLDGDGCDEIVDPRHGYLNPKSNTYQSLARPIAQSGIQMFGGANAVAGDFDGDGRSELAVADSAGSTSYNMALGTALVIYKADGSAQYYEEFGSEVHGLDVARDGQRDRLVVLLVNRLLLQP